MQITERPISYIEDFNTPPKQTTLAGAMKSINYPRNSINTIQKIREIEQRIQGFRFEGKEDEAEALKKAEKKPEKEKLGAFIFSAICEGGHQAEHVTERTGVVCLDFDSDSPTSTEQWEEFRDNLINVAYVFYTALSVSGCGVMALLEIADPERQAEYFEQMKTDFSGLLKDFEVEGVKLDTSKGGNPAQLRFITYDPNARFKPEYKVYDRLPPPKPKPKRQHRPNTPVYSNSRTAGNAFQICMEQIIQGRVNIADEYKTWFAIGVSFVNTFGESGRNDFHRISEVSSKYDPKECDKLYTDIIRGGYDKQQDLSYFYGVCRNFGVTFRDKFTRSEPRPRPVQHKSKDFPAVIPDTIDAETGENLDPSIDPAPYDLNPYTGEIFDQRGYPEAWDEIEPPQPGTAEYIEMLRAEYEAGAITEYEYAQQADPKAAKIISLFDAVPENNKSRAYME